MPVFNLLVPTPEVLGRRISRARRAGLGRRLEGARRRRFGPAPDRAQRGRHRLLLGVVLVLANAGPRARSGRSSRRRPASASPWSSPATTRSRCSSAVDRRDPAPQSAGARRAHRRAGSSGFIAGESLMGVFIAVLIALGVLGEVSFGSTVRRPQWIPSRADLPGLGLVVVLGSPRLGVRACAPAVAVHLGHPHRARARRARAQHAAPRRHRSRAARRRARARPLRGGAALHRQVGAAARHHPDGPQGADRASSAAASSLLIGGRRAGRAAERVLRRPRARRAASACAGRWPICSPAAR